MPLLTFASSLLVSLLLFPAVRSVSIRLGKVAAPRKDRWHTRPAPFLGGAGIFLAFGIGLLATRGQIEIRWGILVGAAFMFGLGLYDDLREMSPPAKLIGQIMGAAVVIFDGYVTGFFSSVLLNILITVVWLVGITNAINLLDNMDGLAGGIALIAGGFLTYFFWQSASVRDLELMLIAAALAGATLGFLVFNFPPAKIFMGDSGSLFLGFTLAVLAIARRPQASNVFAVMSVPTFIFLLPIIDTTLVTFTRLLRGQSPAQGGKDHTSHRLVAFGLSERQAVLVLYAMAIVSGIVGAAVESLDYTLSLLLIPILVLSFALLAAYLGKLKVVEAPAAGRPSGPQLLTNVILDLTYKRRMLEIALDFFLISIAYYLALWVRDGFALDAAGTGFFLSSLPVVLAGTYLPFFVFGVYRGVWRYFGVADLLRFGRAVLGSGLLLLAAFTLLFRSSGYSSGLIFLFITFLFLGLLGSRSSFRILDQIYGWQAKGQQGEVRVLIYGAGDVGEIALRWILQNPQLGYRVVGFLDNDNFLWGRRIHGVNVMGGAADLAEILRREPVEGVILATTDEPSLSAEISSQFRSHGLWVRSLRLEFELLR